MTEQVEHFRIESWKHAPGATPASVERDIQAFEQAAEEITEKAIRFMELNDKFRSGRMSNKELKELNNLKKEVGDIFDEEDE